MYVSVPTIVPAPVSAASLELGSPCSVGAAPLAAFASPKSKIFGPRAVSMMFAGLMSRCTMPFACAASERVGERRRDLDDFRHRQWRALQAAMQCVPFEQLHREIRGAIGAARADVVNRADVRMVQRRDGARFAPEPLEQRRGYGKSR